MIVNLTSTTHAVAAPVVPSRGALRPLGLDEVRITGGVWADRQAVVCRSRSLNLLDGGRLENPHAADATSFTAE